MLGSRISSWRYAPEFVEPHSLDNGSFRVDIHDLQNTTESVQCDLEQSVCRLSCEDVFSRFGVKTVRVHERAYDN